MSLKIYNTITKSKDDFRPIEAGTVKMYVCGITPYDKPHIGHARCYTVFDVVHRYLEHKGYKVVYAQNFTDIDDKIIKKAAESNVPISELVEANINIFNSNMNSLNILPADFYPRVTGHINEIINHIEGLVQAGFAYVFDGNVYFEVKKFKGYGKLSGRGTDELETLSRIESEPGKKNNLDFALWKPAKPQEPSWDSPWGKGRPGWHIECSAMSAKYLGDEIDIHGGGQDLIFPHHENEIAQSECYTGKKFVHYWMHNGFITISKEKMSKSLGNITAIGDVLEKFPAMAVRMFILSQHYSSPIDFSYELIEQWAKSFERIVGSLSDIKYYIDSAASEQPSGGKKAYGEITSELDDFYNSMDDDFNTAKAIANLNNAINILNASYKSMLKNDLIQAHSKIIEKFGVLGIVFDFNSLPLDKELADLIQQRQAARKNKDWAESDRIRNILLEKGVTVRDTAYGVRWKKN